MIAYKPDEISISPERQRQEFDPQAMEDLRESIELVGLQHAPVVRLVAGKPVLVAGERRIRALRDIFALEGHFVFDGIEYSELIPTVTLGELDRLEAEEAELDENLRRKDLTWQEHARAVERLVQLRNAQAVQDNRSPPTQVEIVKELVPHLREEDNNVGSHSGKVKKELMVARHLANPEVAKAKTLDEAVKVLKRQEQAKEHVALAEKVGATFTADLHKLHHGNCLHWMLQQKPEQFDVILTDPPYGMGADQFGDGAGKLKGIEHHYKDSHEAWTLLMQGTPTSFPPTKGWCELAFKLAKPQAHAYVFCDLDRFHELKQYMELAGWYVHRTPLIDYKLNSGRVPLPDRGPRRCWEMILYAIKGEKKVNHIYPDVIECRADDNMTHGAQKPVELFVNLLMRSIKPGDKVLDTFAGSGTIFPAAHAVQCIATGVEQETEYYGMCLSRLKALKAESNPLAELDF